MPRVNPLPERERKICSRLADWRKYHRVSQVKFAKMIGEDSSVIANCESERLPLRYVLAKKIIENLYVNPLWLASGEGESMLYADIPKVPETEYDDRSLFSDIFDRFIAKDILKLQYDQRQEPHYFPQFKASPE